jgi:hypothetical protein
MGVTVSKPKGGISHNVSLFFFSAVASLFGEGDLKS